MITAHANPAVLTIALALGVTGLAFAQTNTNSQANSSKATISQTNSYSKTEVKSAQQKLKDDGYYNGKIDGVDGAGTRTAIRKYQQSQNLTVNGRLDHATCNKLGVSQS